ncbi:MAG: hypothetical protein HY790_09095 [Deltaproteobacteria bacterium]|nr:hypothetical protein [Deltaproteobacteria bacterium]
MAGIENGNPIKKKVRNSNLAQFLPRKIMTNRKTVNAKVRRKAMIATTNSWGFTTSGLKGKAIIPKTREAIISQKA